MAFSINGSLDPHGGPVLRRVVLANSVTFSELDAVFIDSDGFLELGIATTSVTGHLKAISRSLGTGVSSTGIAGAAAGSFVGTFLTSSSNEGTDLVGGEVDISQFTLYTATPNSGTFGTTTTGSALAGKYFDLSDENSINETSVVNVSAQYHSWGKESGNTIVVNLFESSVFTAA